MIRKILLSTDFSDASREAFRQTCKIAARDQASAAICHVLPSRMPEDAGIPAWLRGQIPDEPEVERRAREGLSETAAAMADEGVKRPETFLERGDVVPALLERAQAFGADLVVVGSHGRTGIARMLLGSVAEKVVRHAHTSVLVARPGPEAGPVIAGTDFSDAGNAGLRAAVREAERTNSPLVVLHALDVALPGGMPYGVDAAGLLAALRDTEEFRSTSSALNDAAKAAAGTSGVQLTCEVGVGDAATWIVRRAEELGARLVVLSTHGRTGVARVVMGSVAEKVVRHAHVSVLAARSGG